VAEDVHVNDRADGGAFGGVGHFARGAVVVLAEFLEMGADFVRDLEGVQPGVGGEEAAVVGGDVQAGVAFVNGAEQAAEVVPERVRVVGVAVLEGVLEGFGGQQPTVLAKGAEQDPVQQLLGAAQDFGRGDGGVLAAEAGEDALADVGVAGVELVGEGAPDGFGGAEQFVEVALAVGGDDAFGTQEEDEAFEQGLIGGQADGLEAFVGLLVRALVLEPRFAHGGDDDPVARQVDGVVVGLVHGGPTPPGEGTLQGIAGALAFQDGDELLLVLLKAAQDGIGELAVHLDMSFPGKRIVAADVSRRTHFPGNMAPTDVGGYA